MATESRPRNAGELLKDHSPRVQEAFMALRVAVNEAGPLPAETRELVVAATFAVLGMRGGFMTHGGRALEAGASPEELKHAVLVTLGATSTLARAVEALGWLDELTKR